MPRAAADELFARCADVGVGWLGGAPRRAEAPRTRQAEAAAQLRTGLAELQRRVEEEEAYRTHPELENTNLWQAVGEWQRRREEEVNRT